MWRWGICEKEHLLDEGSTLNTNTEKICVTSLPGQLAVNWEEAKTLDHHKKIILGFNLSL